MAWRADKKAMAGLDDLRWVMLVHGRRGCAWQEVCAVLGLSVTESIWLNYAAPPRSMRMAKIAQRFKVLRRAAVVEALRRIG